jgi:hypothetical protein
VEQLRSMTPGELEKWVAAQQSDPAVESRIAAVFDRDPGLRTESAVRMGERERLSLSILRRPDARDLLVPASELQPRLARFFKCAEGAAARQPEAGKLEGNEENSEALLEAVRSVVLEMAGTYFDAERRRDLLRRLRERRDHHHAAREHELSRSVQAAILDIEREPDPAASLFLTALCFVSLMEAARRAAGEEAGDQDSPVGIA